MDDLKDRKKKVIVFVAVLLVVLVVLFVVSALMKKSRGAEQPVIENVYNDMPSAETSDLPESKMESYMQNQNKNVRDGGGRRIDSYWSELEEPQDDIASDMLSGGNEAPSKSYEEVNIQDFIQQSNARAEARSAQAAGAGQGERRSSRSSRSGDQLDKYMNTMTDFVNSQTGGGQAAASGQPAESASEPSAESPEEERDRIDLKDVAVRRSDTVSSIDDGVSSLGGSGISSLNSDSDMVSEAQDYPFKCMFVKQEKIKNGSRVPVRLLEDMVVGGQLVPKNTHLMATCTLGSRLDLNIPNIQLGGKILTLNYDAYDANDGVRGIYCPVEDESTKEAVKGQLGNLGLRRAQTMVGGIVGDVINTGSTLISGTGRDRSVTVPAGYQFFLVKSKRK